MMHTAERFLGLVLACACIAACSQKDPDAAGTAGTNAAGTNAAGAGSATAGTSGAGTTAADGGGVDTDAAIEGSDASLADAGSEPVPEDFFPLIDGAEFTYRHFDPSEAAWDDTTTLSTASYKGKPAFLSTGSANPKGETSENVLLRIGTKIHRVSKTDETNGAPTGTVTYEPGFLRFDTAWVGKDAGFEATEDYRRVEYDTAGTMTDDTDNTHTFTLEAVDESITVPVGTLDGCLRVRRQRVLAMGAAPADDDDKRLWFCPGVGKAKEETVSTGATEELVSCSIPGQACP
jgi:hypothetical protein